MIKTLKSTYAASTKAHVKARRVDLGLIHEAKAQLSLDDDSYRKMVEAAGSGKTSSAELDARQRARLLRALSKMGYVSAPKTEARVARDKKRLEDLANIHMAARAHGVDESDYRKLVVATSSGKSMSSADLNARERAKLIKALESQAA